jgi:hypothetical protein
VVDHTTHYLITQVFDVRGFLASHSSNKTKAAATTTTTTTADNAVTSSTVPASNDINSDSTTTNSGSKNSSYYPLVNGKVSEYICSIPTVSAIIGTTVATDVQSSEIGDGNLNLVFICK